MTTAAKNLSDVVRQRDQAEIDKRSDQLFDSEGELATAFGIPPEEWVSFLFSAGAQPSFKQAIKNVEKLREIKELWEDQIEPEELKHWMRQKVPLFGGATPLEKLRQGKHEEVLHALALIKEGIPL